MNTNPYQAPLTSEHAAESRPRSRWVRLALGGCCFLIALGILALSLTAPQHIQRQVSFWLVMGTLAGSSALMGVGMFAGRDQLALLGFILFILPLGAAILLCVIRIARS